MIDYEREEQCLESITTASHLYTLAKSLRLEKSLAVNSQYACMIGPRDLIYTELSSNGPMVPSTRFNQGETGSSATRLSCSVGEGCAHPVASLGSGCLMLMTIMWICDPERNGDIARCILGFPRIDYGYDMIRGSCYMTRVINEAWVQLMRPLKGLCSGITSHLKEKPIGKHKTFSCPQKLGRILALSLGRAVGGVWVPEA